MKIKNLLPKVGAILLVILAMASCKNEVSDLGSELLGSETPNGIMDDSQTVVAFSKKLNPVQSNRLPSYQLGVYNDPVYGKSTINLLSQLNLSSVNPKFGDNPTVDSVYVYLPFYSKATTIDSTTTYTLDSIYGKSPINITISRSNYLLRDFDPVSESDATQNYYSNQGPLFEENLGEELATVENFIPSKKGYVFNKGEKNEVKLGPGLRIALPNEFFQENLVDKEGSEELINSNNFKNFIRGLYFKVSSPSNDGNLFLFDISKADVKIYYSSDSSNSTEDRSNSTYELNFKAINVNTFENSLPESIQTVLDNPNTETGNENLYLRGGDGIISVVELFGKDIDNNGIADELETLRDKKWFINEANLIFYVNQDLTTGGAAEPDRITIYDLKNSNVLADYNLDPTNGLDPIDALTTHLGKLQRGSDGNGEYYKLKITNHISNLINKDSTNVPLGIVVSQNVLTRTTQDLDEPQEIDASMGTNYPKIKEVPSSSVVSPKGTVLYGNAASNGDKRLKLQIYYTEPK